MALTLDPEVAAVLQELFAAVGAVPPPPPGDWKARRQGIEAMLAHVSSLQPSPTDVTTKTFEARSHDGASIHLRWYTKDGSTPGSAALYLHGGGMILGSVDLYDATVRRYVSASGVPMLAVEYRLAPEHPHPTPVEDCYAGLCWLAEHARELGVDPTRIAVMGDSAGGGLAAAVALVARDRGGPPLARQILIYPMLDDRTITPDLALVPFAIWTYDDNVTGWGALLGGDASKDGVHHHAAPARAASLAGLPPTYLEVGELDIFRDEDVEYARRLGAAGVSTELHVHPGVPHVFEALAPAAAISQRSTADRLRVLRAL